MDKIIKLKFRDFECEAELFDNKVAQKFYDNLPYEIELTHWGQEMYGSIGIDLGTENPVPEIPSGGLAYTNQGNYLCIFYGQQPAWPVEYIGRLTGDNRQTKLNPHIQKVIIEKQ